MYIPVFREVYFPYGCSNTWWNITDWSNCLAIYALALRR
jgi:hypothetical protein